MRDAEVPPYKIIKIENVTNGFVYVLKVKGYEGKIYLTFLGRRKPHKPDLRVALAEHLKKYYHAQTD